MLQEKLENTSPICSEAEFSLIADALCYFANNGICEFGHHPKPIYLPPFKTDRTEASDELLELISDRTLSTACMDAFHGHRDADADDEKKPVKPAPMSLLKQ